MMGIERKRAAFEFHSQNPNGIPILIVSTRLGHSKPGIMIDIYGHLIPGRQEEAAQLMNNLMFAG